MISSVLMAQIGPFKGLDGGQREKIKPLCEEIRFSEGDKLFAEGDEATHVWIVVEGQVDLRLGIPPGHATEEQTVDSLIVRKKGAEALSIGWSCFVPPYKMRLSAYCASTACEIVRIRKTDLLNLFEGDPAMGYQFMSHLVTVVGHRFQQLQEFMAREIAENVLYDD